MWCWCLNIYQLVQLLSEAKSGQSQKLDLTNGIDFCAQSWKVDSSSPQIEFTKANLTWVTIVTQFFCNFPCLGWLPRTPQVLSRVRYQRSKPNLYISTEGPATHDALTFTFSNTSLSLLTFSHPAFDQPGTGYVMIYSIFFRFFALHMHDTQAFLLKIPQSGSIFLQ